MVCVAVPSYMFPVVTMSRLSVGFCTAFVRLSMAKKAEAVTTTISAGNRIATRLIFVSLHSEASRLGSGAYS